MSVSPLSHNSPDHPRVRVSQTEKMRAADPLRWDLRFLSLVGLIALAGCAHEQLSAPGLSARAGESLAGDTALFATVVRSVPRGPYHDVLVDPRLLKDDPNLVWVGPVDLVETDGHRVEARAFTIPSLDAQRLTGSDYRRCEQGPGGLDKVPDAATLARLNANPRRPLCIIQGVPRPGGPYFPPGGIDRRGSAPAGAYTVRTVTIDPGKYTVYDVVCVPRGAAWEVVEKAVLFEGWS
jgi:hypothetical protein